MSLATRVRQATARTWSEPAWILAAAAAVLFLAARSPWPARSPVPAILATPPRPAASAALPLGPPAPGGPVTLGVDGRGLAVVRNDASSAEVVWLDAAGGLRGGPVRVPAPVAPGVAGSWVTWVERDGEGASWVAADGSGTRRLLRLAAGAVPDALAGMRDGFALAWREDGLRARLVWRAPGEAGPGGEAELPRGAVLQLAAAGPDLLALTLELGDRPRWSLRGWTATGGELAPWPGEGPPGRIVYAGPDRTAVVAVAEGPFTRLYAIGMRGDALAPRLLWQARLPGTVREAWPLDPRGGRWAVLARAGERQAVVVLRPSAWVRRAGRTMLDLGPDARVLPVTGGWLVQDGATLTAFRGQGQRAWSLAVEPGRSALAAWDQGVVLAGPRVLEVWRADGR